MQLTSINFLVYNAMPSKFEALSFLGSTSGMSGDNKDKEANRRQY
jgi:hypothetical protein